MKYGLTGEEVRRKTDAGEVNGTEERMTSSYSDIIRHNVLTYFNLVNTVLFIIVVLTGRLKNGAFFITIVANACIGIYQEIKAKKLLEKMHLMVETKVPALRDGEWKEIPVSEIVTEETIRLENGMQIPADGVILKGYLEINESMLTGEAETVSKSEGEDIFAGTFVTAGSCEAQILKVGKNCESARIMEDAKQYKRARSILHEDLERLLRIISIAIIPTGIILYITQNVWIGLEWRDAVLKTIAAVVGMIPEGLVVLTSIALAVSTIRLSQKSVLVQDLFSIESLARVDVLCLDKTGTLTQGTMQVNDCVPLLGNQKRYVDDIMNSYLWGDDKPNETSKALIQYFGKSPVYKKTDILPFSSDRKYAAATLEGQGTFYVGAVNFLFPNGCPAVNRTLSDYTKEGKRVIVLAHSAETSVNNDGLPEDLDPVAMVAITDVLRPNVVEIMNYFKSQDVQLKVISGDDPATVSSLAKQAGIPNAQYYVDMSSNTESYDEITKKYTVFGRVLPDQKKELVKALKEQGHTVAMTGDGVNDVPALKTADVSVAMAAGSPAAKDSANIVLLSNDFGQMPGIVDEGRRVINNISRASSMYLVKTVFSILLSLYVVVLRQEYPFLPIHLSLISALGVGIPTFFLQMEPSFERVKGRFFTRAFRNAVPSAVTVLILALFNLWMRYQFNLPVERYYAVFVSLTAFVYLYTLFRVYYPPTRLRKIVIPAMAVCFVLAIVFLPNTLNLQMEWRDLALVIPQMAATPFIVSALARVYDKAAGVFFRVSDALKGQA